jgi:hypothetical protein
MNTIDLENAIKKIISELSNQKGNICSFKSWSLLNLPLK